jgi:protein ImuA
MRHGAQIHPTGSPPRTLHDLRAAIEALTDNTPPALAAPPVATGWGLLDDALPAGGLARGAIHEWFAETGERSSSGGPPPPLAVLIHLARRAAAGADLSPAVVWIGRRCWPYPPLLARLGAGGGSLLHHSVFIDARDHAERVWAIDIALRCPGVAAVVGDAAGLSMAESRRLQLAAASGGVLGLIVKPLRELGEISAAHTRWLVRSEPSPTSEPGWLVELLRCKGVRPLSEDARRVAVRWGHETRDVHLVPDALHRPAETARQPIRIRQAV